MRPSKHHRPLGGRWASADASWFCGLAPNRRTTSVIAVGWSFQGSERRAEPPTQRSGRQPGDNAPRDVGQGRRPRALLAETDRLEAERRERCQRSAEPRADQGQNPVRSARVYQSEQEGPGDVGRPGAPGERRGVQALHCQVRKIPGGRADGSADDHQEHGHRVIRPSVRRSPATTASRPTTSVPTRYAAAFTGCPDESRARLSPAYVENVVKPARIPVPKNGRTRCRSGHRSTTNTISTPIRKQP